MTATITVEGLWTYRANDTAVRLPLAKLADGSGHIHGQLKIVVAGKPLPSLGFFGPDDVCLNTWLQELLTIGRTLSSSEASSYTFDEGEQGQSAYQFRREADWLFVSVVDSPISGQEGDPGFQDIACLWQDFAFQVQKFATGLKSTVETEAGEFGYEWWLAQVQSTA